MARKSRTVGHVRDPDEPIADVMTATEYQQLFALLDKIVDGPGSFQAKTRQVWKQAGNVDSRTSVVEFSQWFEDYTDPDDDGYSELPPLPKGLEGKARKTNVTKFLLSWHKFGKTVEVVEAAKQNKEWLAFIAQGALDVFKINKSGTPYYLDQFGSWIIVPKAGASSTLS